MNKDIIYGIGGLMTGILASKELQDCQECTSLPLNTPAITPSISISDYLDETEFNPNYNDWWLVFVGQNAESNPIAMVNFYNIDQLVNGQSYVHTFRVYNLTTKQTVFQQDTALAEIDESTGIIKLTSGIGTTTYDTTKSQTRAQIPSLGIDIVHQGYPVKFNDGNLTIVEPGYYIKGFDIPGTALGTIGGSNVVGFSNLERAKWNMNLGITPRYSWIPFSGSKLSGIFCCMKFWRDGGLWYNGQYVKPSYFEVINSTIDSKKSKKVIAYFQELFGNPNQFLELNMTLMDEMSGMPMETLYFISIVLNGTVIDQGFAWQESSVF